MSTIKNAFGVKTASLPKGDKATCVPLTIKLDASGSGQFYSEGGDGSSVFAVKDFQTIYIDNSANAEKLNVTCNGTLISFSVPANSQGYFPVVCPIGSFGLAFDGAADVEIPVALFDVMLPTAVWKLA